MRRASSKPCTRQVAAHVLHERVHVRGARAWFALRPSTLALLCSGLVLASWFARAGKAEPRVQVKHFTIQGVRGPERAVATWAEPATNERLPIVLAFHGKGESVLGPARGYAAWVDRYDLPKAYEALLGGVLGAAAFGGLVRERELVAENNELAVHPFVGVLAVGVYTPDLLRAPAADVERYATWVARTLLPELRRSFSFASERMAGVDGVSLGGMVALEVGLRFPDVFASVGAIQPAVRGREAELAERALAARAVHTQELRLLSSDADPLLPVTRTLSEELRARRVSHRLLVHPGGHDYAFNRGPGAIELLRFHDRALREP